MRNDSRKTLEDFVAGKASPSPRRVRGELAVDLAEAQLGDADEEGDLADYLAEEDLLSS